MNRHCFSPAAPPHMPAEWECANPVVLMAWPDNSTDWAYMLDEARLCFADIIATISRHARVALVARSADEVREFLADEVLERISLLEMPINDTWTRDYGPITVTAADGSHICLDFTFNGWGMKFAADLDNRTNRRLDAAGVFAAPLAGCKEMVLEGGSIDCDGHGHMLVTSECLLSPNRNPWLSRDQITARLTKLMGLRKVLWLDHGYLEGDDTDSHIDTLARFAPGHRIVYVGCPDPDDPHHDALDRMRQQLASLTDADGQHFELVELPMAPAIFDEAGARMPSTYANYLCLPGVVIMPSYGCPELDSRAAAILGQAYGCPVESVDCRALVQQHGSLHCSTMQIPGAALNLNFLK